LDFLIAPPSWAIMATIVAGLLLIWWDSRRNPVIVHRDSATVQLQGVQAQAEAGSLSGKSSVPSTTESQKSVGILDVGHGNVTAGNTVAGYDVGIHMAGSGGIAASNRVIGGRTGIVLGPARGEPTPKFMSARDVIHYMRDESRWGRDKPVEKSPEGMSYDPTLEAFSEFSRGAGEGGVRVLGRRNGTGEHVEIPSAYWHSAVLDPLETLRVSGASRTAGAVANAQSVPVYTEVTVHAEDVRRKWPP
jgi:hypothetical protein